MTNNDNVDNVMHPSCGLKSLVDYCNVKTHDIWEGDVMIRREI